MAPGKKRPIPDDLPALAEQLVAEPQAKANNLPVLLAALKPGTLQATPVLHSLRLFFIDCFGRGDLSIKPPPAADASPAAVYAAWLHRQYTAYLAALLRLLGSAASGPRAQVAALLAAMECVRGERPGVFNNRLFHRLMTVLLTGAGVAPEVLGVLIARLLGMADVRYFTLASIIKLARREAAAQRGERQGGGGWLADAPASAQRGSGEGSDGEDAEGDAEAAAAPADGEREEEEEEAAAEGVEGGKVSAHDLARTLHDLLAEMPPGPDSPDPSQLSSWCGAAELGLVAPANAGEGARARKRQRRAAEAAAAAEGAAAERQRALWASPKAHQRMLSDAWLAVLRLDLPEDIHKKVLAAVPDTILPALTTPLMLADYLTETLDRGGLPGMLALHGIFLLVTRHGLEYPRFYARLYQLITPDAFHAKHRARFFSLADVFLASGMVPAYTAAAFVKRLARLALGAPPGGAQLALAFMHNVLRRHPAAMQLLHRPPRGGLAGVAAAAAAPPPPAPLLPLPPEVVGGGGAAGQPLPGGAATAPEPAAPLQEEQQRQQEQDGPAWRGEDVFDLGEPDPASSRALESSLWELEALRRHSNPQVAAYCSLLDKDLRDKRKTAEADISELLAASYASMFGAEAGRRLKAVHTAFYRSPPEALFGPAAAADFVGWNL